MDPLNFLDHKRLGDNKMNLLGITDPKKNDYQRSFASFPANGPSLHP